MCKRFLKWLKLKLNIVVEYKNVKSLITRIEPQVRFLFKSGASWQGKVRFLVFWKTIVKDHILEKIALFVKQ